MSDERRIKVKLIEGPIDLDASIEVDDGLVYFVFSGKSFLLRAAVTPLDAARFSKAIDEAIDSMEDDGS